MKEDTKNAEETRLILFLWKSQNFLLLSARKDVIRSVTTMTENS